MLDITFDQVWFPILGVLGGGVGILEALRRLTRRPRPLPVVVRAR